MTRLVLTAARKFLAILALAVGALALLSAVAFGLFIPVLRIVARMI